MVSIIAFLIKIITALGLAIAVLALVILAMLIFMMAVNVAYGIVRSIVELIIGEGEW